MAHEKFRAEVLTPEGKVFDDEVEMVSTKTALGSIGILAHHEPVLAILDPTELRLYRSESDVVSFAQSEGYLQVANNRVLRAGGGGPRAGGSSTPASCASGSSRPSASWRRPMRTRERQRMAQRDKRRWETFFEIAEGS